MVGGLVRTDSDGGLLVLVAPHVLLKASVLRLFSLFGITSVQIVLYFQRFSDTDNRVTKNLVGGLFDAGRTLVSRTTLFSFRCSSWGKDVVYVCWKNIRADRHFVSPVLLDCSSWARCELCVPQQLLTPTHVAAFQNRISGNDLRIPHWESR